MKDTFYKKTKKYGTKLVSLESLKSSIEMQMEIDFYLKGKRYLLEPIYDKNGVDAISWSLSTDKGRQETRINSTLPEEVLNVEVNNIPLKSQWQDMDMIFY